MLEQHRYESCSVTSGLGCSFCKSQLIQTAHLNNSSYYLFLSFSAIVYSGEIFFI